MSSKPRASGLQRLRSQGNDAVQAMDTAAGRGSAARIAQRRAGPGSDLGAPPKGRTAAWRVAWRRAKEEWPQLEGRDRAVLTDYLDVSAELAEAKKDMDRFGRLDDEGRKTGAYQVWIALHDRVAKLRRDLAGTTSTRERVPIRKPRPEATVSTLAAMKG